MKISSYTVPEASGNFCERGGRFGSHSSNESMAPVFYKRMVLIAFFNAGVRALDMRDPYHPRRSATTFQRSRRRPTSAASRATARNAARWRSRPTSRDGRARLHVHRRPRQHRAAYLELTGKARSAAEFSEDASDASLASTASASWRSVRCRAPPPINTSRRANEKWREIRGRFPRDGWPAGKSLPLRRGCVRRQGRALRAAQDRLLQLRPRCRRR